MTEQEEQEKKILNFLKTQVLGVARHSETMEEFVVYRKLREEDKESLWVRPKTMFLEVVERDGKRAPRFEYIGD